MKIFSSILLFLHLFATDYGYLEPWTAEQLQSANTAGSVDYMNNAEKTVVLYMNLARLYPDDFNNYVLEPYAATKRLLDLKATKSLQKDLASVKNIEALQPSEILSQFASAHATDMGKKGRMGHNGSGGATLKKRLSPLEMEFPKMVAENCDYGNHEPLDIVMNLLIDDGVKGYGHRNNILDRDLTHVGVSIKPHKNFEVNCVMDFGG
jgi:uncharacterized protein YkwD